MSNSENTLEKVLTVLVAVGTIATAVLGAMTNSKK